MPSNRQLFLDYLGKTSPSPMLLEITGADGVFMYGPDGKKYLDLISGVSVSNTGHKHPEVIAAIKDQVDSYTHLMVYGEIIQSPQVKYASLLASQLPGNLQTCYFVNSGSEAVEGALKVAKKYTGRSRIISFRNSYHGSTHGALSIQGSETYKNAFRPLLPDTFLAEFNDMDSLELIDERTACVVIEPVQAEAGVKTATPEFMEALHKRCVEKGALLIFDEIQTGFGRTGTLWAFQKYRIVPDILLLAKALGGGMPLGAFISSGEIMSALTVNPPLGHITTFGGHPVCCAAGFASLNVILKQNLIDNCLARSDQFVNELKHPLIKSIRREGLLLAVELVQPALVNSVVAKAPEHGLILDYFLFCPDSFRIAPPLTITSEEVSLACNLISELLVSIMNNS